MEMRHEWPEEHPGVHSALTGDTVEPDATRVFAFVDTNVLLHYRFFRDVDWAEELGADEATLVLAPVVVEELDEKKWTGARRVRGRAKKVLKALKGLGLSATPGKMRSRVQIFALDEEPTDALFKQHRLQPRISDDRLLASVLAFAASQSSDAVIKVLTADTGLSLKATTRQIAVASPDERLRRNDEPDETERELATARRELAALRAAAPKLKLTLGGEGVLEYRVRRFGEFGTERLEHLLEAWRSQHPYVAATPDSIVIPGGGRVRLGGLAGLPGFWSKKDAARHNAEIDRVSREYEAFLRRWPACVNALTCCIEFRFVLENSGTAPADDIDVLILAGASGRWRQELPKLPRPPAMPRPRHPLDIRSMVQPTHWDPGPLRLRDDPIQGPIILDDEPGSVRYTVKRVKHHVPCDLPPIFFQFDADEEVRSFSVGYRLVAANVQEPKSDDLHVKLAVDTVAEPPSPETVFSSGEEDGDSAQG